MRHFIAPLWPALSAVLLTANASPAVAAPCKLSIVIDHSGSMAQERTDGSGRTRCYSAAIGARNAIAAFVNRNFYDIVSGEVSSTNDDYDRNCPDLNDRLVSIWVFAFSAPTITYELRRITESATHPDGFVPAPMAARNLVDSGLVLRDAGTDIVPIDQCLGVTPLAQAMCRSARDFVVGPPAAGELRKALVFSDGGENISDTFELPPDEARCRLPGEPEVPDASSGWGARVIQEYQSRSVAATGFLFGPGTLQSPLAPFGSSTRSALDSDRSPKSFGTTFVGTTFAVGDEAFFETLAQKTDGAFTLAADDIVLDPTRDTDGDGIPDYRDFCPFAACAASDLDQDGIPDEADQCLFTDEDGRGAFPADGCPDTDGDGVPNVFDVCPATFEDWLPPKRDDGCPTSRAVPAGASAFAALLGLGLLGLGLRRARQRASSGAA